MRCSSSGVDSVFRDRMSRKKANAWILSCSLLVYLLNRFLLKHALTDIPVVSYILKCHLNDYLGGIAFICYVNLILLNSKYADREIKTYVIAVPVAFMCGLLWEYVFPLVYSRGVSDVFDVLSYVLGGITYIYIYGRVMMKKKPLAHSAEKNGE